jgi:hypothetical protein
MTAAPEADRPAGRRRLTPWLIGVGVVTFLAGLLFGYDQGVWRLVPETKGRSLEEIQADWQKAGA